MEKRNCYSFIKESRVLDNGAIFLAVLILYSLWNDLEKPILSIIVFTILFMICSAINFRGKSE